METATLKTSFHDSRYHSKRLRELLLSRQYKKPTASIHVIQNPHEFELSLLASYNCKNKVVDILLE